MAIACALAATTPASSVADGGRVDSIGALAISDPTRCPPIPTSFNLDLTPEEWQAVDGGEIDVRVVKEEDGQRYVRAVGYLDADPVSLFDVATDSELTAELVDIIKEVEVLEEYPTGKVFRGAAKASLFLPRFDYTLAARYLDSRTGQCWTQLEGDFRKNEGTHSFLWDAERGQSLAVFTFEFALKGILRVVPEWIVLRLSGRTLPGFMRRLESLVPEVSVDFPARAAENAARWESLRARLAAGELPDRLWRGYPPPPALEQTKR